MVFAIVAALTLASDNPAVVPLTQRTFSEVVKPEELWMVKFYAPWCGHCKRLAPILDSIAEDPEALGKAHIAKVDCTVESSLCSTYNVKGFPTLLMMHDGQTWEHRGPRSKGAITALLTRMQRPPVRALSTVDDLQDALIGAAANDTALFVLGTGKGSGDAAADALSQSYHSTARARQHLDSFASTASPEVLAALFSGAASVPTTPFVVRVESGETPVLFDATGDAAGGESTSASKHAAELRLSSFVEEKRLPFFNVVHAANFHQLASASRPLALLTMTPASAGVSKLTRGTIDALDDAASPPLAAFRALARDSGLQEKFVFALLDYDENEEHVKETYFVPRDTLPRIVVLRKTGGSRSFAVDTPGSATGGEGPIRAFLDSVAAGSVHFEYEGHWGLPDRWWRAAKGYVPALEALDFLPTYTFVGLGVALVFLPVAYLILSDIFYGPVPEYNYPPPRTKKTD